MGPVRKKSIMDDMTNQFHIELFDSRIENWDNVFIIGEEIPIDYAKLEAKADEILLNSKPYCTSVRILRKKQFMLRTNNNIGRGVPEAVSPVLRISGEVFLNQVPNPGFKLLFRG